jgi:hypothetical protein
LHLGAIELGFVSAGRSRLAVIPAASVDKRAKLEVTTWSSKR